MTGNYQNTEHNNVPFLLGCNEFKSAVVTIPQGKEIAEGEILQLVEGKMVSSAGGADEKGLAIMVGTEKNDGSAPKDVACRVCISGRVNKNVLTIGGEKATDVQVDVLRNWSIVPVTVVPCGQADNK